MTEFESPQSPERSQSNSDLNFDIEKPLNPDTEKKELEFAKKLSEKVSPFDGKAFIVGGYARDEAMRRAGQKDIRSKDIDIEVYGVSFEQLKSIIEADDFKDFGTPNLVGKSFGVIKIGEIDISLPRRDSKVASGHRGFEIEVDPNLSLHQASLRRDLTINALLLDPITGEIVDPVGGLEDLENKILRAVDLKTFGEDPLRALRLAQFAARFGFQVDEKTIEIAKNLPLSELPNARIGEEWRKLLLKSSKPSIGLEIARQVGVIEKLHPALFAIIGVEQEADFHPEGDVWTHSLIAVDVAAEIVERESLSGDDALTIKLAALLHDLGKPATTQKRLVRGQWRITSYGHEEAGIEPTRQFLSRMEFGNNVNERVEKLVRYHMYLSSNPNPDQAAIRRLSTKISPSSIQQLSFVMEADRRGRVGLPQGLDEIINLTKLASEVGVTQEPQRPIIQGRDLIALGLKPGKKFGEIIRNVQEAYLSGNIQTREEALELANQESQKDSS